MPPRRHGPMAFAARTGLQSGASEPEPGPTVPIRVGARRLLMVDLYGRSLSRRDVARHAGMLSQFAGVRLMTLQDGVERGIRMLEFRTGTGFRFTVLVDRALDVADCEFRGAAIGWHSPSGFRHPGAARVRGRGRPGVAAVVLRAHRDLRSRSHPVHALGQRRALSLRAPEERRQLDPRQNQHHPCPPDRLRRGVGRRRVHALLRRRRAAIDRIRRRPPPGAPHRGEGRVERDSC